MREVSKYGVFFFPTFRMKENTDQKKLRVWTLFTQRVLGEVQLRYKETIA